MMLNAWRANECNVIEVIESSFRAVAQDAFHNASCLAESTDPRYDLSSHGKAT
jgi:hypothetical protein